MHTVTAFACYVSTGTAYVPLELAGMLEEWSFHWLALIITAL